MSGVCLSPRTSRFTVMFALSPTKSHRRGNMSARIMVLAACLLFFINARCSRAENVRSASEEESTAFKSTTATAAGATNETGFVQMLQGFIASSFDNLPPTLTRKLLGADMRPECSLALLRTVTAFKKLEPWTLRREWAHIFLPLPRGALEMENALLYAHRKNVGKKVVTGAVTNFSYHFYLFTICLLPSIIQT